MTHGYFKDLPKRTASDKLLRHKVFNTAENHKYVTYQRSLASMVYKFLIKSQQAVVLLCYKINN